MTRFCSLVFFLLCLNILGGQAQDCQEYKDASKMFFDCVKQCIGDTFRVEINGSLCDDKVESSDTDISYDSKDVRYTLFCIVGQCRHVYPQSLCEDSSTAADTTVTTPASTSASSSTTSAGTTASDDSSGSTDSTGSDGSTGSTASPEGDGLSVASDGNGDEDEEYCDDDTDAKSDAGNSSSPDSTTSASQQTTTSQPTDSDEDYYDYYYDDDSDSQDSDASPSPSVGKEKSKADADAKSGNGGAASAASSAQSQGKDGAASAASSAQSQGNGEAARAASAAESQSNGDYQPKNDGIGQPQDKRNDQSQDIRKDLPRNMGENPPPQMGYYLYEYNINNQPQYRSKIMQKPNNEQRIMYNRYPNNNNFNENPNLNSYNNGGPTYRKHSVRYYPGQDYGNQGYFGNQNNYNERNAFQTNTKEHQFGSRNFAPAGGNNNRQGIIYYPGNGNWAESNGPNRQFKRNMGPNAMSSGNANSFHNNGNMMGVDNGFKPASNWRG